jgi:hypothetical protein
MVRSGRWPSGSAQLLASASPFITAVTALIAGGWVGILVSPAGRAVAVVLGAPDGVAYVAAFLFAGYRLYTASEPTTAVRFPSKLDSSSVDSSSVDRDSVS